MGRKAPICFAHTSKLIELQLLFLALAFHTAVDFAHADHDARDRGDADTLMSCIKPLLLNDADGTTDAELQDLPDQSTWARSLPT